MFLIALDDSMLQDMSRKVTIQKLRDPRKKERLFTASNRCIYQPNNYVKLEGLKHNYEYIIWY